jgi:hypothetical protein
MYKMALKSSMLNFKMHLYPTVCNLLSGFGSRYEELRSQKFVGPASRTVSLTKSVAMTRCTRPECVRGRDPSRLARPCRWNYQSSRMSHPELLHLLNLNHGSINYIKTI